MEVIAIFLGLAWGTSVVRKKRMIMNRIYYIMNKFIRPVLFFTFSILPLICLAEPSGRGWDPDAPDIGLPSGSEVGIGLLIALIAVPLGYLMLKSDDDKSSSDFSLSGCIGMIFFWGGLICLTPLLFWIAAIGSVILSIGIGIFIVILILFLIFGRNN